MNISLPESLRDFVNEQVAQRGYGTSSEYLRELIRVDQERQRLHSLLLAGATSPAAARVDASYYDALRTRIRKQRTGRR